MTITIKYYIETAEARGWKWDWIDEERNAVMLYPPGEEPIIIRNNITELSSAVGSSISSLKSTASVLAAKVGFIVPKTVVIEGYDSYEKALPLLEQTGRLVVKPMDAAYGDGISANVTNKEGLEKAVEKARKYRVSSEAVIAQEFCNGRDFRLFVLNGKIIAAIERAPLSLVGDGQHTTLELLKAKIDSIKQSEDNKIKPVEINIQEVLDHLRGHNPNEIIASGVKIVAQGVANLSKGGEAIDVTDTVNPGIANQAVALCHLLRMQTGAVDVLSEDISKDQAAANTVFIEVNVAPGFRGHYFPSVGKQRQLAPLILDAILEKRQDEKLLQKIKNKV